MFFPPVFDFNDLLLIRSHMIPVPGYPVVFIYSIIPLEEIVKRV